LVGTLVLFTSAVFSQQSDEGDALTYSIRPGDILHISVWGEVELNREVLVRPDGGITFPLAGEIQAAGKTVKDLNDAIAANISRYIPEADVTVTVKQILGNAIYVLGQVKQPGAIVMNPRLDVLQALSIAGGTTAFADLNGIRILRRSSGTQVSLEFRYSDVVKGRNLEQNILLEPGDVIVVP
jgi:polysaccharide export outer membrane protein